MRIVRALHAGECFGVRDAVAQALTLASDQPLTILGDLVHNPDTLGALRARGVRQVPLNAAPDAVATRDVMITAHGASDRDKRRWEEAGFRVHDGTCPLVRRAHDRLRSFASSGCHPVIVGRRGHVEVEGLRGDHPEASVVETVGDVNTVPAAARYGVVSQTTQPLALVRQVVEALRALRPEAEVMFADTVCQPTKDRQSALERLCAEAEVVVVVGGRSSHNTRRLAERARALGRLAFHVERAEELQPRWFVKVGVVGVTAGTSTPDATIEAVEERLESFSRSQALGTLEGCAR